MKFFDSYGKEVVEGSIIIIEKCYYNLPEEFRTAIVSWDAEHGVAKWSVINSSNWYQNQNFYGVYKFKLKE